MKSSYKSTTVLTSNYFVDPYVKIWMLLRGKRIEKKKTQIIHRTLNPNFHQNFSFNIPMIKLREIQFEITVKDYDRIGRNDTIGKVHKI